MSARQELKIFISAQGDVSLDVHGAEGPACLTLTEDMEKTLGPVTGREKKPAYYGAPRAREQEPAVAGGA